MNPLKIINGWNINKIGRRFSTYRFEAERDGYSMPFCDLAGAVKWAVENPQPEPPKPLPAGPVNP